MSSKSSNLEKMNSSLSIPKVLITIGVSVAGILILAFQRRRSKVKCRGSKVKCRDSGAFIQRFRLVPFPQAPHPAPKIFLSGLTFAVNDDFDLKEYVTSSRNPDWIITREVPGKTAVAITTLLTNGATCAGKAVVDEITGQDTHYGTPAMASYDTDSSAVAVAEELVDFAIGIDTIGEVRIPALFCGILGFRPSHGSVSTSGALRNSQSLDTIGVFALNTSVLHRVGYFLQLKPVQWRKTSRIIVADDLFQLHKDSVQKNVDIVSKILSDYQAPKTMNFGRYIMSNVPTLSYLCEQTFNLQNETNTLKTLSFAMLLLQSYEYKTNQEEWINYTVKPWLGSGVYDRMHAEIIATPENIRACYRVRTEMRAALGSLLKDDGILVIPTIADTPLKLKSESFLLSEFLDRAFPLLSVSTMSGCCQVTVPFDKHVTVPFDKHEDCLLGVSYIANHGSDHFLLDTVTEIYQSRNGNVGALTSLDLPRNKNTRKSFKKKAFKKKAYNAGA